MFFIIIVAALFALRYFEIGPFANMSWWWPVGAAVLAFIWFEFFERMLGLDKRRSDDETEKLRQQRVKETFSKDKKKR
ncbi:MAG: TIGR04438 family Trp-rich protein [Burkholderiaceae bacterium]|nr:TIGR04438 family Trp-rich protein [Burkholderiaceae bacterium]